MLVVFCTMYLHSHLTHTVFHIATSRQTAHVGCVFLTYSLMLTCQIYENNVTNREGSKFQSLFPSSEYKIGPTFMLLKLKTINLFNLLFFNESETEVLCCEMYNGLLLYICTYRQTDEAPNNWSCRCAP